MRIRRTFPILVIAVALLVGCAGTSPDRVAYNSISDATSAVQNAVSAYKAHCAVAPGDPGPGVCAPAEYANAKAAYVKFQGTASAAVDIAARTGQTPLAVVSSAAAEALALYASLKGGK